jgi:hypothetical protein
MHLRVVAGSPLSVQGWISHLKINMKQTKKRNACVYTTISPLPMWTKEKPKKNRKKNRPIALSLQREMIVAQLCTILTTFFL